MTKKLSKNIIIYGGTNALKSLVPLLMLPILTKYLTINDYGILSLVETTILFVSPLVLLNINAAINVEYFKLKHNELKEYITNALLLSFISFLIMLLMFFLFKDIITKYIQISNNLVVLIVVFSMLRVVTSVTLGLFQIRQEPIKFGSFTLLQTIFDFALSYIFVVLLQCGYIGRLAGVYISFGLFSLVGLYLLYKMDYLTLPNFKYTKNILNFGIPLIPHAISGTIMAMSDRYFISYFADNEQVGLYTIAYQLSALMLLISMSANQAWTPVLFELLKKDRLKVAYKFTFYLFLLFLFSAIIIFFLKDILFIIFVDKKYYIAKEYFSWLLLGFVFQSFYFLVTNYIFFKKRTKLLASITVIGAIINIILNYIFIVKYGVVGVAYATAITWLLLFIVVAFIVVKIDKKGSLYEKN